MPRSKLIHVNKRGYPFLVTWGSVYYWEYQECDNETLLFNDVIMSAMVYQITSDTIVYSTVYSDAEQRKHQGSASVDFVWGIHRWPVNSPHKGPVTRKLFPYHNVIMKALPGQLVELSYLYVKWKIGINVFMNEQLLCNVNINASNYTKISNILTSMFWTQTRKLGSCFNIYISSCY